MKSLARVDRLSSLRRRIEQVCELELHLCTAAVAEMDVKNRGERMAGEAEASASRKALAAGDAEQWLLAETGRELVGRRILQQQVQQRTLEEQRSEALQVFTASRIEREQMEAIAKAQRKLASVAEERRLQASTDDRFLSRQQWLRSAANIDRNQ